MARLSIQIELAPEVRVGPGRVRLLELIAERGSISAADRALGVSYRRAWLLVDELHRTFAEPVVEGQIGGRGGGGAVVTPFGIRLIASYRTIEQDVAAIPAAHLSGLESVLAAD